MAKDPICIDCKQNEKHKTHARCKQCINRIKRERYNSDPDYRKKVLSHGNKESRAATHRRYIIKSTYGITVEQYDEMFAAQDGKCAICLTHSDDLNKRMSVDHDHNCCIGKGSCGKCVRGLLCSACNLALGGFKDNEMILSNAVKYLQRYSSVGDEIE